MCARSVPGAAQLPADPVTPVLRRVVWESSLALHLQEASSRAGHVLAPWAPVSRLRTQLCGVGGVHSSPCSLSSQCCARRRACPQAQGPQAGLAPGAAWRGPATCFQNLPQQGLPLWGAAHSPSSCLSQELLCVEHEAGLLGSWGALGPHTGAALQPGSPPATQPPWDLSHFFLVVP